MWRFSFHALVNYNTIPAIFHEYVIFNYLEQNIAVQP